MYPIHLLLGGYELFQIRPIVQQFSLVGHAFILGPLGWIPSLPKSGQLNDGPVLANTLDP